MRNALCSSPQDVLEAARLETAGAGLGIAMHGIAHPQHRLAGLPYGVDGARQCLFDLLHAEAMDQGQSSGLIVRIRAS